VRRAVRAAQQQSPLTEPLSLRVTRQPPVQQLAVLQLLVHAVLLLLFELSLALLEHRRQPRASVLAVAELRLGLLALHGCARALQWLLFC
jgi:hypothetical protein